MRDGGKRYAVKQSATPLSGKSIAEAEAVAGVPAPAKAGTAQAISLRERHEALRGLPSG
ncbi:MAG: hypothetical protein WKF40_05160 [Thermoleophilaceae bacterium]